MKQFSQLVTLQVILAASIWGVDYAARHFNLLPKELFLCDSPSGYLPVLLAVEFFIFVALGFSKHESIKKLGSRFLSCCFLCLVALALLGNLGLLFSHGKPIVSGSLFLAGAVPSRWFLFNAEPWIRRFFEPSWLLFLFCVAVWFVYSGKVQRRYLLLVFFYATLVPFLEAVSLKPFFAAFFEQNALAASFLRILHIGAMQGVFLFLLAALNRQESYDYSLESSSILYSPFLTFLVIWCGLLFGFLTGGTGAKAPLIGAHYYLWFPYNWKHGVIGQELKQNVEPLLGRYRSDELSVFQQHKAWAREAGIDYFIFDWWPERKNLRRRILSHVQKGFSGEDDFSFAIQYETLDLKTSEKNLIPGEADNMLLMNAERAKRMALNWEHIARHYFSHPNYLRIHGRPVLYLYASRHLLGDVSQAITRARSHVRRTTGHEVFLIGDEVFFNVPSGATVSSVRLLPDSRPDWRRLTAFDALTSYNPYDSSRTEFAGSTGARHFISQTATLYRRYQAIAASLGQVFIRGILPGYNDRPVRLNKQHFVVPRELPDGESFFSAFFNSAVRPVASQAQPMLAITSWNEWNEATQIEPTEPFEEQFRDSSLTSELFTQGEIFDGYHCRYLEQVRSFRADLVNSSTRSTK